MADIITNGGRAQVAGYLSNTVSQITQYYGNVGTGAGTAAVADTTLFTEVGTARVATTMSRVTTTVTNDTARNVFTFTAGTTVSVTNAGIWTASSGGTLMQKSDHATIPLLSGDSVAYTFDDKVA